MARKEIGTQFTNGERNDMNDNFIELYNVQELAVEQATQAVINDSKLIRKEPVDTFTDLATTYPDAVTGYAVMTRDTGKVYRFNDGAWGEIEDIDPTAINEVDTRLSAELADKAKQLEGIGIYDASKPISLGLEGIESNIDVDQSGKLQAIIDAVPENSTIVLPKGRYKVNPKRGNVTVGGIVLQFAVKLKSNIKIEFREADFYCDTQIDRDNYYFIMIDGCTNIDIYGKGVLEGDRIGRTGETPANSGEWGHGIAVMRSTYITIRDELTIKNMFGDCISLRPIENQHNMIKNITIKNINLIGARRNNLTIAEGENIKVRDCYFERNGNGQTVIAPNAQIDIEEDFNPGVGLFKNIEISNNIFEATEDIKDINYVYGVLCYTAFLVEKIENLKIINNTFHNHNRTITLEKCNNSLVENNIMTTNSIFTGIQPDFADIYIIDCKNIIITKNKSKGQPVYAVKARGVNTYIEISNNQFVDALCGGALIPNVEHFHIRGNEFIRCGSTNLECVLRVSESSKFVLITENKFIDNPKVCIQLFDVTDIAINNNVFNQTVLSCMEIRTSGKRITIEGNSADSYAINGSGSRFIRSLSTDAIDDILIRGNRARKGAESNALYCVDLPTTVVDPNILVIGNDFKDSSTAIETWVPVGTVKNANNINTEGSLV